MALLLIVPSEDLPHRRHHLMLLTASLTSPGPEQLAVKGLYILHS